MSPKRRPADRLDREVANADRVSLGDAAMGSMAGIRQLFEGNERFFRIFSWLHWKWHGAMNRRNRPVSCSHSFTIRTHTLVKSEWCAILKQQPPEADGKVTLSLPLAVFTAVKK